MTQSQHGTGRSETLGRLLKAYRGSRPQSDVARDAGKISQSLLSAWENEKAIPTASQLAAICRVIAPDNDEVLATLEVARERSTRRQSFEAGTTRYVVDHMRNWFNEHDGAISDIWVLGPTNLPVLTDEFIRDYWDENLLAKRNYNLVWMLDLIDPARFREALPSFAELLTLNRLDGNDTGSIHFYATNGLQKWKNGDRDERSRAFFQNKLIYEAFQSHNSDRNHLKAEKFVFADASNELQAAVADLMAEWASTTAILLYQPANPLVRPMANVRLMETSVEPIESVTTVVRTHTYHLGPTVASRLSIAVERFKDAYQSAVILPPSD